MVMGRRHSRTPRLRLSDDVRRILAATGAAVVLHGAVFAGIELTPERDRTNGVTERIAVVITPTVSPTHQQRTPQAVPEASPDATSDATSDTPAGAIPDGEPRDTPVTVDSTDLPEPTDASVAEHLLEEPQMIEPQAIAPRDADREFDQVTPVRLSDGMVDEVFGDNEDQPEPEASEGESVRPTIHPDRRYVKPEYPERARRAGIEGTTVVTFEIDRRGRPNRISLEESSGSPLLDREAIRAVQLWRFSRGNAGRVSVHRIAFRLEEGS